MPGIASTTSAGSLRCHDCSDEVDPLAGVQGAGGHLNVMEPVHVSLVADPAKPTEIAGPMRDLGAAGQRRSVALGHRGGQRAVQRAAVLSLPALGGFRMHARSRHALLELIGGMADPAMGRDRRIPRPRRTGRWRLLLGMVLANRPWLLVPD